MSAVNNLLHRVRRGSCMMTMLWVCTFLAACASTAPAPVVDRAVPGSLQGELGRSSTAVANIPAVPVTPLGPGMYMVKKGDTLRAIALDHGQSYRDLAAWNGLSDPNHIEVGQVLRVVSPDAPEVSTGNEPVAVAKPVNISRTMEPVATTANTTSMGEDSIKRTPKGGKLPYAPGVLEKMQQAEQNRPAASTIPTPPVTSAVLPAPPVPAAASPAGNAVPAVPVVAGAVGTVGTVGAATKTADDIDWAWPGTGKLISGFVEDKNKGIDLTGKKGDPVLAAASGKVILVSNALRGYGNFVIVKHNNTFLSVYAHNSQILVKEEQTVSKGQKIAEVGDSDADQPKLHFEIRRQGKPVDPLKLLPGR